MGNGKKSPAAGRTAVGGIKAIIFDCDGVLIDSREAHLVFFNRILGDLGLPPMSNADHDFVFVHTPRESLERLIPPPMLSSAIDSAASYVKDFYFPYIHLEPGISEFLDFLKGFQIAAAVNTNAGNEVLEIFNRLGLDGAFDAVVTADDVSKPKPDTEGLERILCTLGLSARDAVFIGDSAIDESTARAAGVPFWAYKNPDLKAQKYVNDFFQLKRELQQGD